eukprot:GAHX01004890.1.p1 GENE.GAHX01004890.1~~GAHX01004890.1.p1  ORF type:complete len:74 (-),score=1.99 GAHX01004890.1:612-833(-)
MRYCIDEVYIFKIWKYIIDSFLAHYKHTTGWRDIKTSEFNSQKHPGHYKLLDTSFTSPPSYQIFLLMGPSKHK